jgi:hypothetical protein
VRGLNVPVHRQNFEVNVEGQNVEWDKMRNDKMSHGKKCRKDKLSNGTKRRVEIMSKVRKADWDKMSNGKKMSKAINAK